MRAGILRRRGRAAAMVAMVALASGGSGLPRTALAGEPNAAASERGGLRDRLERRGVELEGVAILDGSAVIGGQVGRGLGLAGRALLDGAILVDAERALSARGLHLLVRVQGLTGPDATPLTGDVQVFDNIDANGFVGIAEAWIEQRGAQVHPDGEPTWSIKLGRMDANEEFASVDAHPVEQRVWSRRLFVHSSMGFSPTMLGFPSYPNQALGVMVDTRPTRALRLALAAFDGALAPSLASTLRPPEGPAFSRGLAVGELGIGWGVERRLAGHLSLGGYARSPRRGHAHEGGESLGLYAVVTQTLRQERGDPSQGIVAFLQYGYTPSRYDALVHHGGGGVSWIGAFPRRDADAMAAGASWVAWPEANGWAHETAVELTYRAAVQPWLTLQPDAQWILNPGGGARDALALTLRVNVEL